MEDHDISKLLCKDREVAKIFSGYDLSILKRQMNWWVYARR